MKELLRQVKESIITNINKELENTFYINNPYEKKILFEIVQTQLITGFINEKQFVLFINMIIHRPFKTHTFNLQFNIIIPYDNFKNNVIGFKNKTNYYYKLNDIKIIGNTMEANIEKNIISGNYNYEGVNKSVLSGNLAGQSAPFSIFSDFETVTGIRNDVGDSNEVQNKINNFNELIKQNEVTTLVKNNQFLAEYR